MAASRRRLTVAVAVLIGLALVGGIAVRVGCGETDEPIPRAADAGGGGAPGAGAVTAVGAHPFLAGDGASAGMARISGTVRDVARVAVPGVEIRFTGADGESSATTDRSGRYRVDLAGGRYQVRAVADHAVSFERRYLAVPAGLEIEGVDFDVVRTARVSGRVIDGEGRPIDGAAIGSLTWVHSDRIGDDDIAPLGGGTSGDGGSYAVVVPAGEVRVTASHGARTGATRLHWVEPGSQVSGVEIVIAAQADTGVLDLLDRTRISALVDGDAGVDAGGIIAGTVRGPRGPVAVFDVQLSFDERLRFLSGDGSYRIEGVLPGERKLTISAPGLAPAVLNVIVAPGALTDGSATLVAGAGIEGTITSATTGRPIAGVQVTMTTGQDSAYAHTDEAGRYVVHDIAAGRRGLEARHPGFVGKIVPGLQLEPGKTVRKDLALEPVAEGAGREVELAGIGVSISTDGDGCRIVGLVPGGPAELAKLRAGDVLVEIDGRPVAGWSFPDVVEAIRGVVGTVVRLEIQRGEERFRRDVVRAAIRYRED